MKATTMPVATEVQDPNFGFSPKVYERPTPGLHEAIITEVRDMGEKKDPIRGITNKITRFTFKITDQVNKDGSDMLVFETMTQSLGEKARLGMRLRGLGFDTTKRIVPADIVGLPVTIGIVHNTKGANTYANVDSAYRRGPRTNTAVLGSSTTQEF
jgi:hypothetical protein